MRRSGRGKADFAVFDTCMVNCTTNNFGNERTGQGNAKSAGDIICMEKDLSEPRCQTRAAESERCGSVASSSGDTKINGGEKTLATRGDALMWKTKRK